MYYNDGVISVSVVALKIKMAARDALIRTTEDAVVRYIKINVFPMFYVQMSQPHSRVMSSLVVPEDFIKILRKKLKIRSSPFRSTRQSKRIIIKVTLFSRGASLKEGRSSWGTTI